MFETIDQVSEPITMYRISHVFDPCGLGRDDTFYFDLTHEPNKQFIIESPAQGVVFIGYLWNYGAEKEHTGIVVEQFDDVYTPKDEQYRSRDIWYAEESHQTYEELEEFFQKVVSIWMEKEYVELDGFEG